MSRRADMSAGRSTCAATSRSGSITAQLLTMSPDPAAFDKPERLDYDPHADAATSFFRNGLLVGEQLEDVAIFGQGVIDGNRTRSGGPKAISLKRCRNVSIPWDHHPQCPRLQHQPAGM